MNLTSRARASRPPGHGFDGRWIFVLLMLSGGAAALKTPWDARRPRQLLPQRGRQVKQFALADIRGRAHTSADWRERKGVALFFLALDCPVVDAYAPEMRRLAAAYDARGIAFYGVHSCPGVTPEAAARHAAELGLRFPVLLDPAQVVAGEAGVRKTPEAVLLAPDGQVLYGGQIDASFEPGDPRRRPARASDLEAALRAVVAGEMPIVVETKAYGCPLPAPPEAVRDGPITYNRHVAPILRRNCVSCHQPGEVGPFSLLTYRDAAKRADFLREITASRRMPPWKARPGCGVFLDALRLTDRELEILARWTEAGAPEGDPADLPPLPPPPPRSGSDPGWQLGRPDHVFSVAAPLAIPADGDDLFRSFRIPLPLDHDQQVVAFEFRPGNRKVVHHAKLVVVPAGSVAARDAADPGPDLGPLPTVGADLGQPPLWEWTPGTVPRRPPPGVGMRIKSGSDLILFLRYHPSGKPETDQSSIGVTLSKARLSRFLTIIPLGTAAIDIPAGARRQRVVVKTTMPADAHAYTLMPHAHLLLRELTLTVTRPDGTIQRLLWIDDWDPSWPGQYHFAAPVPLPRGTELELAGVYDNSAANPRNPNAPPRRVRSGPASTDEMLGCHIQVIPDRPRDYPLFRKKWPQGL